MYSICFYEIENKIVIFSGSNMTVQSEWLSSGELVISLSKNAETHLKSSNYAILNLTDIQMPVAVRNRWNFPTKFSIDA